MNLEFHYWIVLFMARKAGLDSPVAQRIAYASQLVDDRRYPIAINGDKGYEVLPATQPLDTNESEDVVEARMAYHFLPGDREAAAALRKDHKSGPYVVSPRNPLAKTLLIQALKSNNLYRIGIALHAYADTWAHQNFSAPRDPSNILYENDPIPPIGHAPALKKPDLLNEVWEDPRLLPEHALIHNRSRFMEAARMIYKYLAMFNRKSYDDLELVETELELLWGSPGIKGRRERYLDYAIATEEPAYDATDWLISAGITVRENGESFGEIKQAAVLENLLRKGGEWLLNKVGMPTVTVDASFYGSDFYQWNRAAAEHMAAFRDLIPLPLFQEHR